uniref:aromatic acid exporter family protein n=1 Tax=Acetatifactor sp. TaxID=1872090 RepID=UPI004056617D
MKKIAFNTIKISLVAMIAIFLATILQLNYAVSAGTVAILSIQPTKRETVKTAAGRLLAFICALVISVICFELLGYSLAGFAVFVVLYILVCQIFGWYSAMAVNTVLMSHFLTVGNMNFNTVSNECLIFLIGVGMGVLANLHLHKNVDYIEELKENTDNQIRRILHRMSERILNSDMSDYNGECFTELRDSIRKAKNVADENYNNQLICNDIYDKEYIRMRERQCQVLFEMYKNVCQIHTTPITARKISDFLEQMSSVYHKTNTGKELMEQFQEMDLSMKSKPLPTGRTEFEDRARLFYLLRYIEEFIQIKIDFAEQHLKHN